ncbi:MAG TPA: hypothetical protein VGM09_25540 [Bradyrhizobium sp.]
MLLRYLAQAFHIWSRTVQIFAMQRMMKELSFKKPALTTSATVERSVARRAESILRSRASELVAAASACRQTAHILATDALCHQRSATGDINGRGFSF